MALVKAGSDPVGAWILTHIQALPLSALTRETTGLTSHKHSKGKFSTACPSPSTYYLYKHQPPLPIYPMRQKLN